MTLGKIDKSSFFNANIRPTKEDKFHTKLLQTINEGDDTVEALNIIGI